MLGSALKSVQLNVSLLSSFTRVESAGIDEAVVEWRQFEAAMMKESKDFIFEQSDRVLGTLSCAAGGPSTFDFLLYADLFVVRLPRHHLLKKQLTTDTVILCSPDRKVNPRHAATFASLYLELIMSPKKNPAGTNTNLSLVYAEDSVQCA